jgi:uncharacterized repeat protein (TIGR01451 family)
MIFNSFVNRKNKIQLQLIHLSNCLRARTTADFVNWSNENRRTIKSINLVRILCFAALFLFAENGLLSQQQLKPDLAIEKKVKETLKKNAETLRFMENKGQLENKDILYYYESKKSAVYIEKSKIRFVAKDYEVRKRKFLEDESHLKGTHTLTLNLNGSNSYAKVKLGDSFSTRYNYFFGKDATKWISGVMAAKDITIENIYTGIDIRLYSSNDGTLEFDWILKPGADYSKINMNFEGQDNLSVQNNGSLKVGLRFTDLHFNIPESYQVTEEGKIPVKFAFHTDGVHTVNFKTSSPIDPKYPLVIDPILTWGTFMDGNDPDFDQYLFAIQVDQVDGMVYCAGATNREISTSSSPYDANGYLNAIAGLGTAGTPRVAIIYRISSSGSDLVDLSLYGPGTVDVVDDIAAFGLSLSNNRVFICGKTTADLPMVGSPFDGIRDGNDGFVAVFSKDLGTLQYATYLGSWNDEYLGATSIRAINDNTFVVGLTAMAALPAAYISASVPDKIFGGGSEMYIARFTSNNILQWGTYVGGADDETFNDLEVFTDGRVAFAGWGNNTIAGFTEVNSAATQSNLTDNTDGIIGVLNSSATAFDYLDEIGGPGDDRINDIEIVKNGLAWTGSASVGFPTSAGAYDVSHNGGTDVIVGLASTTGGSASYKATFFGGSGNDIGAGIKEVTQINCAGTQVSFYLVFGTTAQDAVGIPTVNLKNESFYSPTNSGGLDIFFAGFNENVSTLKYATNIGGPYNDYLGDTGDPRGANHLCVKGGNIYVGTTTHSETHNPAIVGGSGFDQIKSNTAVPTSDDVHVIFSIQFTAILETDYSDAPSSYGTPSHILDCTHLNINTVDDGDSGPIPTVEANGDDLDNLDDENGILNFPNITNGGPQNISILVKNVLNTTGSAANLYAWIDLNGDGVFKASEIQKVTLANGYSGDVNLTWSGVNISGPIGSHYLRLRLTTDNLNDDTSTPNIDERSIVSASDGEVEDYSLVVLNCPASQNESSCQLQSTINTKYAAWLASVTAAGGCDGVLTNNGSGIPSACGASKTVTFTYTGTCIPFTTTCSSVFTVASPSAVVLNCPGNLTEASCQTQSVINAKYASWLATATMSGGCNPGLSNNSTGAPSACGGSKTVIFTVTSSCEAAKTCSATFTVNSPASISLNCPVNVTEPPCQGQAVIDSKFASWLATANANGGCNGLLSNNNSGAPDNCLGGTKTVTFTYTNSCSAPRTCNASFTVTPAMPSWNLIKTSTTNPNHFDSKGDLLTYSITINNTGNLPISNVVVTDPLADNGSLTYVAGDLNNDSILDQNETWIYSATHTVKQPDLNNGYFINTATATGTVISGSLPPASDTAYIPAIQSSSISLIKTGSLDKNVVAPNGIANVGDKINYTFMVTNNGNVTLSNIIVTDPILTVSGGPISLAPGTSDNSTFIGTYTLTQADIDSGKKDNTATVTGKNPQNQNVISSDDETTLIPKIASISLVKTGVLNMNVIAPNGIANVGDKINYTFKVTNTGNVTLTNVVVTDPLVSVSGGPITLLPGATDISTFTAVYTLTQSDIDSGIKYNTATTNAKDPQSQNVTNSDDETTTIPKSAGIAIIKTGVLDMNVVAPNGIANPGDKINYTFKVTNTGNVTLTNVTVTDPIVSVSGGPITLAPGATDNVMFTGVYTLTQGDIDAGFKYNTATATGKDPQNISVTNGDDETTSIPKIASIAMIKNGVLDINVIAPNGIANPGDKINYSFKVTNTGNVTLTNVTVTDPIVSVSGGPITLAPGASDNISFNGVYTMTQSDIDAGFKYNTATATGKDPQNLNVSNGDDETTLIPKIAGIALVKTGVLDMNVIGPNGVANVGDKINYSFKVTNTGNVTLANIAITDPLVTVNGGPITLAPGASNSTTFTGVYTLTQTDIDAGFKYNVATTTGKDPQNQNVTNSDDETTVIPKMAGIALVKTGVLNMNVIAPNGIANPGDKINYTFKVTNTGNVTLSNITVTDPIVTVSGGPITLAPGATDNVTFTGVYSLTQTDIDAGFKYNVATTTGKDPQNINVTNGDDETTSIPKMAGIALVKTGILDMNVISPNGIANPGDKINYTFKVTNTGNVTLANVTVSDPIVSVSGGPITLAPGATDNITFTGVYTLTQSDIDAGFKYNTATTTGRDPQNIIVTSTDDETTVIPKIASIALVKTGVLDMNAIAPNGIANPGDKINYTFKVTNTGNVTLTNIAVTDPIITVSGGPITLAPGAVDNITFTGVYTLMQPDIDAGFKYNTATTTGRDPQNIIVTSADDETTLIPKIASIALVKTGVLDMNVISPNGITNPGDRINYSFKVTNTGNVTLTNIKVTDPIVTVTGGPITLAPGAADNISFTGVYTLTQADIDAGFKYNTATTTGKDPQNISVTNGDDETTVIPKIASIALVKTGALNMNVIAPNGIANPGDRINYTFKVTNTGNVTLTNVIVVDPIITVLGGPISLAPGAVDNGTFTGVYTLTQMDIDAGYKYNNAITTAKDPQDIMVTNSDDEMTTIPKVAAISLIKTGILDMNVVAPGGIANVGDKINYTFKVTNTGNVTLHNVIITDPIVTVIGGPVTLAPGATDNTTFKGSYILTQADIDSGKKDNTATVNARDPQNMNVTNSDDETTLIPMVPKIILEKTGTWNDLNNDGYADVGETISYKFKVCNTGNVTLSNVALTDPLITIFGGPIPVLAVSACNSIVFTGTYVITQLDIDTGKVVNVATAKCLDTKGNTVSDNSDDPNDITNIDPDNDGDPDDPTKTNLPQNPKIGISKKLLSVINNLDGTFSAKFELTMQNNGNVTLGDVQITDNITNEFGNYKSSLPLYPGEYTITNFNWLINSGNLLTLNTGFNGKSDYKFLKVIDGGTIQVGEKIKIGLDLLINPIKYEYYNQAVAIADKPNNDDPVLSVDDDPEDTKDLSDSGANATNNSLTGGTNPGEPGDKGTIDDPTLIKLPAGQLKGTVWDDLNGNGLQDSNEPGLKGIEAWLYNCDGTLLRKDTTDALGNYAFDFLQVPMNYYVVFQPGSYASSYGFTFQNIGLDDQIDSDVNSIGVGPCTTIDLFEKDSTYDAGMVRYASIGNSVWIDKNGDGVQDPGEAGIKDVSVTLYDALTQLPIKNVLSNSTGKYLFNELMPGDYYLKFTAASGWIQTLPNVTSDFQDSDVDNANGPGTTVKTHLSPGEDDLNWDAGYYKCAKLDGYIWLDNDLDGVFDPEEKGINGMNVFVVDAATNNTVATMKTKVTPGTVSMDGYYAIDCIKPGTYYLKFERPVKLAATAPYKGNDPNKDNDITHENGINTTRKFSLSSGETVSNIFGGFQIRSEVGDMVWIDKNFNGIQDSDELPLADVKVAAFNIMGVKVSESLSGPDGRFMLDGLADGEFYVKFDLPNPKYGFTKAHAGQDDNDSDVGGENGYGSTNIFSIYAGEIKPTIDAGVVAQLLPIEWLNFSGNYNGEFVELNWTTGVELDNDYFVLERKTEIDKDFVSLEKIASHANPNLASHDYEYDDFDINTSGVIYYRLKQVDKDGSFTYSKIISVHVKEEKQETKVTIYPNPVSELLKVEIKIPLNTEVEAKVFDQSGRVIMSVPADQFKSKGKSIESIPIKNLIPGQYVLEIKTTNEVIHKRFTVSR